ncbi:MAG: ImmA/IrrE family metallo-endopeptidase [Phycisphaerae bacterium]|nr:ImmA/IrrE family metallo-endopeptidase [Phycisphaerae bacterium]
MGSGLSDRLKSARESTGLTQEQVAERTGIDDSTISKFENGRGEPRLGQLERLGEAYHLPLSYFFSNIPHDTPTVLWRNEPTEAQDIAGEFIDLCRQYHQLEIWTGQIRHAPLPNLDNGQGEFGYIQAQRIATEARKAFALGDRPGQRLAGILGEVYGVKIFHMDLGDSGIAACAFSKEFRNAILLNKNCTSWRRNFDLVHELFHLLTWKRFRRGDGICKPDAQEEKLATCFAANLLLPEEILKNALDEAANKTGKIPFSRLDAIAREFDVSLESLFWRMHFLYHWKEEHTKKYIGLGKQYIKTIKRQDVPSPEKFPERYRALAIQALQNGEISIGRFAQFMNTSRHEAQQYLAGEECGYAEIPTPVS